MTIARGIALAPSAVLRNTYAFPLAFAGYAFLAVIATFPLALHVADMVPHDLGDPLLSATILWWNAHTPLLSVRWWDGFFFAPATGALAFSDHRLGESLIATPLIRAGVGPLAAYNLTLLATFPLCAIAAHWLAYTLTKRHDASLLAGLAYGFNPYRFAHIEHLELLAAFGMPAALAALHLYLNERRTKWLAIFAAALLLQALLCSYYFLFFFVMLALWLAWYVRRGDRDVILGIGAAMAVVLASLSPLAWSYRAIHHHYGLSRGYNDIITLSADLTSFLTASPLVALWGWTSSLNGPERQLFPGLTIVLLAIAGVVAAWRALPAASSAGSLSPLARSWQQRTAIGLVATAGICALAAWWAQYVGPWYTTIGAVTLSVTTPFKPFSLAVAAAIVAFAVSPPAREAYRHRSHLGFYLLAASCLFLCSLGPKPAVFGHQFLYEPPYAWLMRVAMFGDSVRVPARFAMVGILALSIAAAVAFARLTRGRAQAPAFAALAAVVITAEGWSRVPLLDPPPAWPQTVNTAGIASFVELPLGETLRDAAAMYRAMATGIPTVNGYSGYQPSYYEALRLALDERDETALDALSSRGPLLVVVDRQAPYATERESWLSGYAHARPLAADGDRAWFVVDPRHEVASATSCDSTLPIAGVYDRHRAVADRPLTDGREDTAWTTGGAQHEGDALVVDLGRVMHPCSIQLSLGSHVGLYPRVVSVAASSDGDTWQTTFSGKTGGRVMLAALMRPRDARIELPLCGVPAQFVRVQLEASHSTVPWLVTDIAVTASRPE